MFKKLLNKIVMGTKCYLALKEHCTELELKCAEFEMKCKDFQYNTNTLTEQAREIEKLHKLLTQSDNVSNLYATQLAKNKKTARKIVRTVNGLIKREDSIQATKDIKALCNQIIKGE